MTVDLTGDPGHCLWVVVDAVNLEFTTSCNVNIISICILLDQETVTLNI